MAKKQILEQQPLFLCQDPSMELCSVPVQETVALFAYDVSVKMGTIVYITSDLLIPEANFIIAEMLTGVTKNGGSKHNLILVAVGGADNPQQVIESGPGATNFITLRKILWKHQVMITSSDVGGHNIRTAGLDLSSGDIWCQILGKKFLLHKSGETL